MQSPNLEATKRFAFKQICVLFFLVVLVLMMILKRLLLRYYDLEGVLGKAYYEGKIDLKGNGEAL